MATVFTTFASFPKTLKQVGLTAHPNNCSIKQLRIQCLGIHLGHGKVRPQTDKTTKWVRHFWSSGQSHVRGFFAG